MNKKNYFECAMSLNFNFNRSQKLVKHRRRPLFLNRNVRSFCKLYTATKTTITIKPTSSSSCNVSPSAPEPVQPIIVIGSLSSDSSIVTTTPDTTTVFTAPTVTVASTVSLGETTTTTTTTTTVAVKTENDIEMESTNIETTSTVTKPMTTATSNIISSPDKSGNNNTEIPITTTSDTTSLSSSLSLSATTMTTNALKTIMTASEATSPSSSTSPERVGQPVGVIEHYIVRDKEEAKITRTSKMMINYRKELHFCKKGLFRRAKTIHPILTRAMYNKFENFTKKWLDKNVTELQLQRCNDWLMGRSLLDSSKNFQTICTEENDLIKTPYRIYNRYKLEKINNTS